MIKKNLKRLLCFLLACVMMCTVMACTTTLKGTYVIKDGLVEQRLTFKEDNKVEVSAFGIDVEGTYKIEDGKITIIYSLLGLNYDIVKNFDKDGGSIFIDGTEFVKQK